MSFAGRVWRLLVGIKDGLVLLLLLLFFGMLFAVLSARPNPAQVHEGALLVALDGVLVEERTPIDPFQVLLAQQAPTLEYQVRDVVRGIDAAAGDPRIKAVALDLDRFLGGGHVHLQEVGSALDRVRKAGKPVYAFATAYTDDSYLLAAHASEVWLDPLGGVGVIGPGGHTLYLGGLLERLKVNARVFRVGTFKAAVEPYTRTGPSPEAAENTRAVYGALWEEWQAQVRTVRPRANIASYAADPVGWTTRYGGDLASAAKAAGLVDTLGSRNDFERQVARRVGAEPAKPSGFAHTPLDAWLAANAEERAGGAIGVVTIAGTIVDGDAGPGTAGGERIADLLDEALDDGLKGLVVRVDSPGGSVLASEEIRRAILRHKAVNKIPVAVSMANLAASGGYWVSTPADRIFAEPETITGSIGIFAVIPTFERLAADWGVATAGPDLTPLSGQPDLVGGLNEATETVIQSSIENGYRDFLTRVAASRRMTPQAVDRVAQGRIWDGGAARQVGLVDAYGGIDDALAWVAGRAGLKKGGWHAVYLGAEESSYDSLLRQWLMPEDRGEDARDLTGRLTRMHLARLGDVAHAVEGITAVRGMQAYCLQCPARATQAPNLAAAKAAGPLGWLRVWLGS